MSERIRVNIERLNTVLPTVDEASKAFLKLSIAAESHKRCDKATVTDKMHKGVFSDKNY